MQFLPEHLDCYGEVHGSKQRLRSLYGYPYEGGDQGVDGFDVGSKQGEGEAQGEITWTRTRR